MACGEDDFEVLAMLGETGLTQGERSSVGDDTAPAAVTDVGCERDINEDRYAVIDCSAGKLWVVCDGMGGVQGGELAAQLAVDAMRRGLAARSYTDPNEALTNAADEANRVIVLRRQNPAFSSMGTTVVAVMLHGDQVIIGNAGDSRAYLVRGRQIQQLTTDHTYVQDLVERGAITEEEAMHHPQAHVLTKCLGSEPRLEIAKKTFWLWDSDEGESDDKLLLCSDGLYSHVPNTVIAELVDTLSPQEACHRLVELAKADGGFDNITVAVIPLGGVLRDEQPPVSSGRRSGAKKVEKPSVSILRHAMIAGLLAVVGGVLTMMAVFLKMSSE